LVQQCATFVPPAQTASRLQVVPVVHGLPSSHAVPDGTDRVPQLPSGLHTAFLQRLAGFGQSLFCLQAAAASSRPTTPTTEPAKRPLSQPSARRRDVVPANARVKLSKLCSSIIP